MRIQLLLSIILLFNLAGAQTIYKSIDKRGNTSYSDRVQPGAQQQTVNLQDNPINLAPLANNQNNNYPQEAQALSTLNKRQQQRLMLKTKLKAAYKRVIHSKQQLQQSIVAWQQGKTTLDNISPTFNNAIKKQQAKLMILEQTMENAKAQLAQAQANLANVKAHYQQVR